MEYTVALHLGLTEYLHIGTERNNKISKKGLVGLKYTK